MSKRCDDPFQAVKPPRNPYRVQGQLFADIFFRRGAAERLFGIEHFFLLFICGGLMLMPAMAVRAISGHFGYLARKISVESYAIAKLLILGWILFSGQFLSLGSFLLAVYFLIDLYLYLCGLIFLRRFYKSTGSPTRSLLLLGVNFCELLVAFAIFYGHTASISLSASPQLPLVDPWGLLYFSCVTSATVGYGDMTPNGVAGQKLILFQIISSISFASIFISFFVNNLSAHESAKK